MTFGKSDPSHFYYLNPTIASSESGSTQTQAIGLLPVEVPKSVRRPQLVYVTGENEVALATFSRWAEPLGDGLSRVITENLAALVPGHRVESFPFAPGEPVTITLSIRVTQFQLAPSDSSAHLAARWSIYESASETRVANGSWSGGITAADSSAASLVATMSGLVGDLTRAIVAAAPVDSLR